MMYHLGSKNHLAQLIVSNRCKIFNMYKLSAPILVFLLFGGISLDAQSDQNARDLVKLSTWFEGSFDNDSQLWL